MVKGKRKPVEEIYSVISKYSKILIVGCGGCVSVCLAGGQKEVFELIEDLKASGGSAKQMDSYTVERQCNMTFLAELDDMADAYDCIVSMACGAGVQYLAERFANIPVFPAINTIAIGVDREIGVYEEKCRACGQCVLSYTGGICPVTKCAKGLFNGPCGGTNSGMCEINNQTPCAWHDIYTRLKDQGRLDDILKIQAPMQWQNQVQRTIVQDAYAERYAK
ncbi:MAG: hypothetical protein GXP53_12820 [Deltaproteobacteria bacterium]|nr:hypothetical protein [Deltaproteobacteria bacterium]